MQQDFNKVFYNINNLRINAAGTITSNITSGNAISGNITVTNPINLDLDSIDSF